MSESTKASRLYWWTAEYGLVGGLDDPKLYGAGLLSSLGEAAHCLTPAVKKVPLSLVCADTEYDITRMQPQLFVARDFDHLFEVLEAFEATLGWRRGADQDPYGETAPEKLLEELKAGKLAVGQKEPA